jgi:hypothetical protein
MPGEQPTTIAFHVLPGWPWFTRKFGIGRGLFAQCARASEPAIYKDLAGRMGEIGPAKLAFVEPSRAEWGEIGARLSHERR